MPTLGILTLYQANRTLDAEELAYFRSLTIQGAELGLDVFVFTPEDAAANAAGGAIRAHVYRAAENRWRRERRDWPDAVYDRCRAQRSPRFGQMRSFRAAHRELRFLNHPLSSKWGNHQVLERHANVRAHLPETRPYRGIADLKDFTGKYPAVYVKPVNGSGGRGIARFSRTAGGALTLTGRSFSRRIIPPSKGSPEALVRRLAGWGIDRRFLIQQGIPIELPDGRVHDYRLLIQKDGQGLWQVTGIAGRIGGKGSATSNLHGGGEAVALDTLLARRGFSGGQTTAIREEMERLARDASSVLEQKFGRLCELALDLAVDPEGHVWLLEVNPKPSREVFKRIGDTAAYRTALRRPLEYALSVARRREG